MFLTKSISNLKNQDFCCFIFIETYKYCYRVKRIIKNLIVKNQNVGPTTVGKITGGQGVSDF